MNARPATRYGCPTCDTQGPLLPHEAAVSELHRAAHQMAFAMTSIVTESLVAGLTATLGRVAGLPDGE